MKCLGDGSINKQSATEIFAVHCDLMNCKKLITAAYLFVSQLSIHKLWLLELSSTLLFLRSLEKLNEELVWQISY